MLVGPKRPFPAQMSRPGRTGSSRTVGGGLYGAPVFAQSGRLPHPGSFETAPIRCEYKQFQVFFRARMAHAGPALVGNQQTLAIRNLTGSGANRILNRKDCESILRGIYRVRDDDQPTPESRGRCRRAGLACPKIAAASPSRWSYDQGEF